MIYKLSEDLLLKFKDFIKTEINKTKHDKYEKLF